MEHPVHLVRVQLRFAEVIAMVTKRSSNKRKVLVKLENEI